MVHIDYEIFLKVNFQTTFTSFLELHTYTNYSFWNNELFLHTYTHYVFTADCFMQYHSYPSSTIKHKHQCQKKIQNIYHTFSGMHSHSYQNPLGCFSNIREYMQKQQQKPNLLWSKSKSTNGWIKQEWTNVKSEIKSLKLSVLDQSES